MSFNEIVGWALFELNCSEKTAKELNISLELYKEGALYVGFMSKIVEYKPETLKEKLQEQGCKFDEALRLINGDEDYD